jgi:hypothetical protein
MTKDFIIGFLLGVIIVLLLTRWEPDDDDTPDDSARQGVPQKYPSNVTELEQKEA